jgi:4,5-dihydroxyphthalate decarboxylase
VKIVVGRDDLAGAAEAAIRGTGTGAERLAIKPVHKASAGFVNDGAADLCELAIVTLLQAAAAGKPVVLLPITTLGRAQHQTLVTLEPGLSVTDVAGRTVGVRSWSQTTGVWVRGFLTEQYGVDLRSIDWVTYEGAHVDTYRDPEWVRRAPEGTKLPKDFLDGRVDFAVLGNELPADDRVRTAIPDADQAGEQWSKEKGFVPVNHVVAVTEQAAGQDSEAICAAYDAMSAVITNAGDQTSSVQTHPVGFRALRAPLSLAARFAHEQGVLTRAVEFDELLERSCAALGVRPERLGG